LRDTELRNLSYTRDGVARVLQQSSVDPCLWIILTVDTHRGNSSREPLGYIVCYVDDIMFVGEEADVIALRSAVNALWNLTVKPVLRQGSGESIGYLGMWITAPSTGGFALHQGPYIESLLKRWGLDRCRPSVTTGDEA